MDTGVIEEIFLRAGCRGWLLVTDVDRPGEVALNADAPVVAASVFKVIVALEFYRQAHAGQLDLAERVRLRCR